MKEPTKNLIEKRIQKEDCPISIKEFILKLLNEESLHLKSERWNFTQEYESNINKYYQVNPNED